MPDFEHQQDIKPEDSALRLHRAGQRGGAGKPAAVVRRRELSLEQLLAGIAAGDRAMLGRAITLIESSAPRHRALADELLTAIMPRTGTSLRVGITGVPGVGKSTFIEQLGCQLTDQGKRVAVLAIDPSSGVSGGSILGDKTRMAKLSVQPNAFIRPSPAGRTLGGVARKTRESMLVCEAAGFDVILVETVGVGQSETMVAEMTDFFLALMLPGAGDELQGIKRGLLELVDMIAVNKADGDRVLAARRAARDYASALRAMQGRERWEIPVVCCSAETRKGLSGIWDTLSQRVAALKTNGELAEKRKQQQLRWMWSLIEDQLLDRLRRHPELRQHLQHVEKQVLAGETPPTVAAVEIVERFLRDQPAHRQRHASGAQPSH